MNNFAFHIQTSPKKKPCCVYNLEMIIWLRHGRLCSVCGIYRFLDHTCASSFINSCENLARNIWRCVFLLRSQTLFLVKEAWLVFAQSCKTLHHAVSRSNRLYRTAGWIETDSRIDVLLPTPSLLGCVFVCVCESTVHYKGQDCKTAIDVKKWERGMKSHTTKERVWRVEPSQLGTRSETAAA